MLRRSLEMDPAFVPALNNLGVVLMERGNVSEARVIFQQAYALDSGQSDAIRENLKQAIAVMNNSIYAKHEEDKPVMNLVRRGQGDYAALFFSDLSDCADLWRGDHQYC